MLSDLIKDATTSAEEHEYRKVFYITLEKISSGFGSRNFFYAPIKIVDFKYLNMI